MALRRASEVEDEPPRDSAGRFPKGVSGNPRGPCPGTPRNLAARLDRLARAEVVAVFQAVVERAKAGDAACAALVLDRAADLGRC